MKPDAMKKYILPLTCQLDEEGREIPKVMTCWFARYAFRPDTKVFQAQ